MENSIQNISDEIENTDSNHNSPTGDEWYNHFSKLHSKHQMNQDHEEIIKNLKDKEKSKDEYNTLDTDIIEYEIRNTALKLKLRKAVAIFIQNK